jgi:DNA-binding NarL/FixJ family response regulator
VSVRILLADDHEIVREGFRALIERQADFELVGEAATGREAVEQAAALSPDVVVIDIGLPELNGIDATRQIVAASEDVRVIALSVHTEGRYVTEMLKAGARGYLVKTCASAELIRAIRAVQHGETYLSSKVAGSIVDTLVRGDGNATAGSASPLSAREREVLALLAEGKTSKQIAFELGVAARTVDLHRQNMMKKLDMYSVAELTKYAIREGITPLE